VENINKIKKLSIWIFIIPFIALNTCLVLISNSNFHQFFDSAVVVGYTFPYIDGQVSISRTARVFPTYLIFKPSMFVTAFFLVQYWRFNFNLMEKINSNLNYKKFFLFFGIGSAIFLVLHSIFLGIKFDNDFYKLFRRVLVLSFIIFEVVAQTILVINFYKIKKQAIKLMNNKILNLKIVLVSILAVVGIASIPFLVITNEYIYFKHALEWNYFIGVITFYLLTFFFWKKQRT
jgi:hypothetical protein|tara:strand:- start:519 stop:1217 length:699 start_codon:yes stop_codon:yes gene_type:complete